MRYASSGATTQGDQPPGAGRSRDLGRQISITSAPRTYLAVLTILARIRRIPQLALTSAADAPSRGPNVEPIRKSDGLYERPSRGSLPERRRWRRHCAWRLTVASCATTRISSQSSSEGRLPAECPCIASRRNTCVCLDALRIRRRPEIRDGSDGTEGAVHPSCR